MSSNTSLKEMTREKDVNSPAVLIDDIAVAGHAAPYITDSLDPEAERRLTRKIDLHIVPIVAMLYLWCFIDRTNIGNSRLAGLEKDLGMKGYDYNVALTAFYISYALCEIPSNIMAKVVGPGKWLPFLTFGFGLLSLATAFVKSYGALIAVRFLLGAFEAGLLPGIAFYMTRWYRKDQLVFRLSFYLVTAPLAGAFGGLLASGILKLKPIGSIERWRLIFLIEGIVTLGIGIISYFLLTDRPASAKWLTEEEKALAEARIKSENAGSVAVVEKLRKDTLLSGILNINTWLLALQFLFVNVSVQGVSVFMPTIITAIYPRETVIARQLKTVPPYIVGAFFNMAFPYLAYKTKRRSLAMALSAPLIIVGFAIFVGSNSNSAKYAATFLITSGAFPFGPLCTGASSANAAPDAARAASIGTVVMVGNIGGCISVWAFTPNYAPRYIPGNSLNLAGGVMILLLTFAMLFYQMWENKQRDQGRRDHRLEGLTQQEASFLGHRHPQWRYAY